MVASTSPALSKYVSGPAVMAAIGLFCLIGSALWFFMDRSAVAKADGKVAQSSSQPSAVSDDKIYQAGVVVGRVYGGRRLPNDATRFEFSEITSCAQFNTFAPFTYGGVNMIFEKEQNSVMFVVGRPDSPIRFGVIARVLE